MKAWRYLFDGREFESSQTELSDNVHEAIPQALALLGEGAYVVLISRAFVLVGKGKERILISLTEV